MSLGFWTYSSFSVDEFSVITKKILDLHPDFQNLFWFDKVVKIPDWQKETWQDNDSFSDKAGFIPRSKWYYQWKKNSGSPAKLIYIIPSIILVYCGRFNVVTIAVDTTGTEILFGGGYMKEKETSLFVFQKDFSQKIEKIVLDLNDHLTNKLR